MIAVLGTKRVAILLALLLLNMGFGALTYLYFIPEAKKVDRRVSAAQSKVNKTRSEINVLINDFEQIEAKKDFFNLLKNDGFFSNQNRRDVQDLLLEIETQSGVLSSVVNFKRGNPVSEERADKADHLILESPVNIKIKSMNDVDIYKYIYLLEQTFPGHIGTDSISIKRVGEVNNTVLRGIVGGAKPALMEAEIELLWRTLIPNRDKINNRANL